MAALLGAPAFAFAAGIQWLPAVLALQLWAIAGLLVYAFLFGRAYCETVCPLGVMQDLLRWRKPRRVCSRIPETRARIAVKWGVFAAFVVAGALGFGFQWLDPYAIFGRVVTAWGQPNANALVYAASVAPAAVVAVLAFFGKGRAWCNLICPVGTVLQSIAKIALVRDKVGRNCGRCRECFKAGAAERPDAGKEAAGSGERAGDGEASISRRGFIATGGALAADKVFDGGFAPVSEPGIPERRFPLVPPGAASFRNFTTRCVGCQLCVANCPTKVLRPSTEFKRFMQPEMGFDHGYCRPECVKCSEVCPTGAIKRIVPHDKKGIRIGHAIWHKDRCIAATEGVTCNVCERHCPAHAIVLVKGLPVVDKEKCIGCGACENLCPARPMPGMTLKGFEVHHVYKPMTAADARAEADRLVAQGLADSVEIRDGVIRPVVKTVEDPEMA